MVPFCVDTALASQRPTRRSLHLNVASEGSEVASRLVPLSYIGLPTRLASNIAAAIRVDVGRIIDMSRENIVIKGYGEVKAWKSLPRFPDRPLLVRAMAPFWCWRPMAEKVSQSLELPTGH